MIKVKAIIAGSRHIECAGIVHMVITDAVQKNDWDIIEVVSGGATGVDSVGEAMAQLFNKPIRRFPANWHMYGKIAGPMRNKEMAKYADVLILIHSNTPGSLNMKAQMELLGKPIYEYVVTSEDLEKSKV